MYYYFQERRELTKFGKILHQKQLVSKPIAFYNMCTKTLFTSRTGFGKHETFIKFKTFLKEFNKLYNI